MAKARVYRFQEGYWRGVMPDGTSFWSSSWGPCFNFALDLMRGSASGYPNPLLRDPQSCFKFTHDLMAELVSAFPQAVKRG